MSGDKKIQIIIGFKAEGADRAAQGARSVGAAVDDLTKKLKNADFSVIGDLEKKLRGANFGQVTQQAAAFDKELGLTKMQALTLTYTLNDVIASLASGGSAFTIAAQQGGQLTQAFGGLRGTVKTLLPYMIRFAPAIAALGAVGVGAALVKISFGAGKAALDMQKAADEAGLTADQFQRLKVAAGQNGLDAEGVVKAVSSIGTAAKGTGDKYETLARQLFEAGNVNIGAKLSDGVVSVRENGKELEGVQKIAALLGVDLGNVGTSAADAATQTLALARAVASIKKPDLQTDTAKALFGSGAADLLPAIRQGPEGVDKLQQSFQQAKPPISQADLDVARQQQVQVSQMSQQFEDASTRIKAALLPIGVEVSKAALEISKALQGDNLNVQMPWVGEAVSKIRALKEVILNLIDAVKLVSDAFSEVGGDIDRALGAVSRFFSRGSAPASGGGSGASGFASGGLIRGPGTGTSDSILAKLSNREYVIRASSVSRYGVDFMNAINSGRFQVPKFATGGLAALGAVAFAAPDIAFAMPQIVSSGLVSAAIAADSGPQSSGRPLTISLDGQSFGPFSGPPDALDALERHAARRELSATTKRAPGWKR